MRYVKDYNIDIWPKNEKTDYFKSDYRSKLYQGNWVKFWMNDVIDLAVKENRNSEEVMWKLCDKKVEHMPLTLFKFFPFNQNSIKCIEEDKVYLNIPENFNDPYDCYLAIDQNEFMKKYLLEKLKETNAIDRGVITEDEFHKIESSICKESRNSLNEHIYGTLDSVLTHIYLNHPNNSEIMNTCTQATKIYNIKTCELRHNRIGICSFSKLKIEELISYMEMWGHYSHNHTGFCVEYDLESQILDDKLEKIIKGGLLPCTYSAKHERMPNRLFYKYSMNKTLTMNQQKLFFKSLLRSQLQKSSSWSYEKEWRLLLEKDFVDTFNGLVPFFKVKKIYLGCKMPVLDRQYMYKLCKRKNIEIYEMKLKNDYYELEPVPVDVDYKMNFEQELICTKISSY